MSGTCNDGKRIQTFASTISVAGETWHFQSATRTLTGPRGQLMRGIPDMNAAFYAVAGTHGGLRHQNPF